MQLNVADIICGFVENALTLPFTIYADMIPEAETDGACIRHDPAPAAERRHLDGSRLLAWNLTFYIRCRKSDEARNYAKAITDALDETTIHNGATDPDIDCMAATLPQFIGIDEKGFTTYSAAITCTYTQEAEKEI